MNLNYFSLPLYVRVVCF